ARLLLPVLTSQCVGTVQCPCFLRGRLHLRCIGSSAHKFVWMILTDLPTISLLNLRKGSRATDPQHTQRFIQLIAHNLSAQPATHALRFNAHKLLSWTTQPACTLLQSTPLLC